MKKIALIFLILFSFTNISFAEGDSKWPVEVRVLEKVPWANCSKEEGSWEPDENWTMKPTVWVCEVGRWTWQVVSMLWDIIKYFTFIAGLLWILFIVYSGILYSMWWADEALKTTAKERIVKTIIGLIILLMSWYILQLLAPWVYK